MRVLSLDLRIPNDRMVNFSVWSGPGTPDGHLKLIIKVLLPTKNNMNGGSKYHHEDIKWTGTDKSRRQAIIAFLSRNKDKEMDIKQAMYYVRNLFI